MTKKEEFISLFNAFIKRPGADKLLKWLENSDFFSAPASTRYHLAEEGGLVEHSVNVYHRLKGLYKTEKQKTTNSFAALEPEEEEKIAIVGLLHDVCKVSFYGQEVKNRKTYDPTKVAAAPQRERKTDSKGIYVWESVVCYTIEDKFPYGHGEKSVYIILSYMKLKPEEAMAIRWHMGFSDVGQGGNNYAVGDAFRQYPLAIMAHVADLQATYLDESVPDSN